MIYTYIVFTLAPNGRAPDKSGCQVERCLRNPAVFAFLRPVFFTGLAGSAWLAALPEIQGVMTVYEVVKMIILSSTEN